MVFRARPTAVRAGPLPRLSAGSGNPLRMEGGSSDPRLNLVAAIGNRIATGW